MDSPQNDSTSIELENSDLQILVNYHFQNTTMYTYTVHRVVRISIAPKSVPCFPLYSTSCVVVHEQILQIIITTDGLILTYVCGEWDTSAIEVKTLLIPAWS